MRTRSVPFARALLLSCLTLLWVSCSSQQQQGQELEVSDQEYGEQIAQQGGEQGDNYAAEGQQGQEAVDNLSQEGGDEYGNEYGGEYANQGNGYENNGQYAANDEFTEEGVQGEEMADVGYDNAGAEEAGAQGDLQDIINDMNEGDAMVEEAAAPDLGEAALGGEEVLGGEEMAAVDPAMAAADPAMAGGAQDPMAAFAAAEAAQAAANPMPFQPGSTPASAGLPEMNSKMAYFVQPGDTLAKIAQMIYGDLNKWREIADLTGMANPSRIYPGDVVYYNLTEQSVSFAQAYESAPRAEEVVQPGDTLAKISQRVYGTQHGWKSIWRQNDKIDNPDTLAAGSVIYYVQNQTVAKLKELNDRMIQFAKNNVNQSHSAELAVNHTLNISGNLDTSADAGVNIAQNTNNTTVTTGFVTLV